MGDGSVDDDDDGQTRSHRNGSCLMKCWELEVREDSMLAPALLSQITSWTQSFFSSSASGDEEV